MIKALGLTSSIDRSKGEMQPISGAWFYLTGDIPVTTTVAINESASQQIPVVPFQIYRVGFRNLTLFHAAGLMARAFSIVAGNADEVPVLAAPQIVRNSSFYEAVRSPDVFKEPGIMLATAIVWTPAAGKIIRLMGLQLTLSGDAACAAATRLQLGVQRQDGVFVYRTVAEVPAAAGTTFAAIAFPVVTFGNGYVMPSTTQTLSMTLATALTAGGVTILLWGTEE